MFVLLQGAGMADQIAAIETNYRGVLFRSRLEARWAVFFDEMLIDWEYEPEGYETPDGRYLPDFRIYLRPPKPTALFEVKPQSAVNTAEDCDCAFPLDARWKHAVEGDVAQSLLVARGIPSGDRVQEWIDLTGGLHRIKAGENSHYYPYMFSTGECCDGAVIRGAGDGFVTTDVVRNALNVARSARFEFGETIKGRWS